jgi:hypothetical protein
MLDLACTCRTVCAFDRSQSPIELIRRSRFSIIHTIQGQPVWDFGSVHNIHTWVLSEAQVGHRPMLSEFDISSIAKSKSTHVCDQLPSIQLF